MPASTGARQKPKPPALTHCITTTPSSSEMSRDEGVLGNDGDTFVSRREIILNGVCFSM